MSVADNQARALYRVLDCAETYDWLSFDEDDLTVTVLSSGHIWAGLHLESVCLYEEGSAETVSGALDALALQVERWAAAEDSRRNVAAYEVAHGL